MLVVSCGAPAAGVVTSQAPTAPTATATAVPVPTPVPTLRPTVTPESTTPAAPALSPAAPALAKTAAPASSPSTPSNATWIFDLYEPRAQRWQDPDPYACTAAAALSMLNTIAYGGMDSTIQWQPTVSFSAQESILRFERAHMTMRKSSPGADPHGWRNALNYVGWGSLDAGVYRDVAYGSVDAAMKAAVSAVARFQKPVGVLSQSGRHAEVVTGYKVVGDDPHTGSMHFSIVGVYLTDPWRAARYRDAFMTYARWRWGFTWLRFDQYRQFDSPYRDPIDGRIGRSEWYGKWVTVEPVK
jgi:hypothetical protein